jgi:hypothetical protein
MNAGSVGLGRPLRLALNAWVSTRDKDQDPELQLQAMREYVRARGWEAVEYVDTSTASDASEAAIAPDGNGTDGRNRAAAALPGGQWTVLAVLAAVGIGFAAVVIRRRPPVLRPWNDAARECFVAAYLAQRPAEFVSTSLTTERDPITSIYRVRDGGKSRSSSTRPGIATPAWVRVGSNSSAPR